MLAFVQYSDLLLYSSKKTAQIFYGFNEMEDAVISKRTIMCFMHQSVFALILFQGEDEMKGYWKCD